MANSRKKVLLRTRAGAVQAGYLPLSGLVEGPPGNEAIPLLDLEGRIIAFALHSVRWVAFVRDFNLGDTTDPERLTRRTFLARPRTEGLWVRLTLIGEDVLEGLAPIDLSLADSLLEDRGIYLIPPDIRSNTQRLFVPRLALTSLLVLAVVTNPSRVKPLPPAKGEPRQDLLFDEPKGS
jgi:hypothetical protein